jgi:CheY-like chemotaxis protein
VRLFSALGWIATARYSAREALATTDELHPDIIFSDISMPEMDGYDYVRALRQSGHTDLPVVALTGHGLEEDRAKAIAAGFNDHLTKPAGVVDLRRIVSAFT